MGRLSNNAEIIADISALRVVTQEIVGLLLLAGGGRRNYLDYLRQGAHDRLVDNVILVPGFLEKDIKERAALTIDQMFDGIDQAMMAATVPLGQEVEQVEGGKKDGSRSG